MSCYICGYASGHEPCCLGARCEHCLSRKRSLNRGGTCKDVAACSKTFTARVKHNRADTQQLGESEPRVTPAMVQRLKAAVLASSLRPVTKATSAAIDAWAVKENAR